MIPKRGGLIVIDRPLLAGICDESSDRVHRLGETVVDDMDRIELIGQDSLRVGQSQTLGDMTLRIAPAPQAGLLFSGRRRFDEDAQSFGTALPNLGRSLDIDFQQDVAAFRRIGLRRAVEVSGDLRPFHESAFSNLVPKFSLVGEHIGGFRLSRTAGTGCPRPAEPQLGVLGHKSGRDRPFTDPTGAGQNNYQRLI